MSYVAALALQQALHARLSGALEVPILDAPAHGQAPSTWVQIGTEEVRDASDGSGGGAEHRLGITVFSTEAGFAVAKAVAVDICDALGGPALPLVRGRMVGIRFLDARARRTGNVGLRRIDLRFRARIEV